MTAPSLAEADTAPVSQWPQEMRRLSRWVRRVGDKWRPYVLAVVLLAGVGSYVRVWLSDRGFWNDELCIAINLRDLDFGQLTGPLKCKQIAPPAWLFVEKGLLQLTGPSEVGLRTFSMIAAATALLLTATAARRAVGRWGSVVAAALVVLSPMLVTYAGELKQYTTEAAVALMLLVVGDRFAADDRQDVHRSRRAGAWMVAGVVAAMFSYSALIVLVGVVAAVVCFLSYRRRFVDLVFFVGATIPVGILSAAVVLLRASQPRLENQDDFFPTGLPPAGAGPLELIGWLPRMWNGFVDAPLSWAFPFFALLLVVGGIVALAWRGKLLWAALLSAIFGAAVCAAALNGLPLQDRVALYLVAPAAIAVAACVDGAARGAVRVFAALDQPIDPDIWWKRGRPMTSGLGVGLLAAFLLASVGGAAVVQPAAVGAYEETQIPRYRDPGRDVLRDIAGKLRPGDRVLVYNFSAPLASWYGRQYAIPVVGLAKLKRAGTCQPKTVDRLFAGANRVWYVHGARLSTDPTDYTARVSAGLAGHGRIVASRVFPGSRQDAASSWAPGWVLVDPHGGADPHPPRPPGNREFGCLALNLAPV
ncbi:glycosyltransferase family 39 protein [Fodinicola acaciae]|uniref:glycosyltransferase family 39 protein n=1 Tax=Fodinicola acaciae TaxID=2681555 RepID=UPI0013CFB492|nr:glycosyltransferase family 39 protein [Fodinicola acaciae]